MSELIRTFICIDLSANLKNRLEKLESVLKTNTQERVSWVKPGNIHLTLRFLGDVTSDQQPQLKSAVEQAVAGFNSFDLIASGTGGFPNLRNPRVFWVGIKNPQQHLLPLQRRIQQALEKSGFGKEDKPFSPHLTIGRVRQGSARETAERLQSIEFPDEQFRVSEVIIMRSDLQAGGSKYTRLATLKLVDSSEV